MASDFYVGQHVSICGVVFDPKLKAYTGGHFGTLQKIWEHGELRYNVRITSTAMYGSIVRVAEVQPGPPQSAWAKRLELMEPTLLREFLKPRLLKLFAECRRTGRIPGELELDEFLCHAIDDLKDPATRP